MKKIKNFASTLLIAMLSVSCADLSYNEITTNNEDWVFNSPIYGVQQLVNDEYALLQNEFENNYNGALRASSTDEADFAISNSDVHKFYNGGWTPQNPLPQFWTNSYTAIYVANNFLEKMEKISLKDYIYSVTEGTNYEELKARFELFPYEVRALRAYYYFELVRAYGDVPLVLSTLSISEANNVERTPAQDVLNFIVKECDEIAEYLPVSYLTEMSQQLGRTNRPFVLGLKARALLYAASPLFNPENDKSKWEAAAKANKEVIDRCTSWGIKLDTYSSLWGNNSFSNSEIIFAVARTADNSFEQKNYPIGVEGGNSGNCPTQTFIDQYEYQSGENIGKTFGEVHPRNINITQENPYENLDPRFAMTVIKNGDLWPLNTNQQMEMQTYEGGFNGSPKFNATRTGYYLRKYVDGNTDLSPNVNSSYRHAWISMRLAEFYLNYAEAIYQLTGDAQSKGSFGMSSNEAINVIHDRTDVMMPHFEGNPSDFVDRYERERLVELAFEDHRFWDVRRWKKGEKYFKNVQGAKLTKEVNGDIILTRVNFQRNWSEKYNLFPIPFSEINKNNKLYQNKDW